MHAPSQAVSALAIGGLDPSGGAGLPADARAMAAFGVHCCGVATAVIAQNTQGVARVEPVSAKLLQEQLDNLLSDVNPGAVKVGMLPNVSAVHVVVTALKQLPGVPVIVDTVWAPSCGAAFSDNDTVAAVVHDLLPLAEMATPNLDEGRQILEMILGSKAPSLALSDDLPAALRALHAGCQSEFVLLKGGHGLQSEQSIDFLCDGTKITQFAADRLPWDARGTGCLLASAIAAQRASGVPLRTATERAKAWLTEGIANAKPVGRGGLVVTLV